ncbi:MAG: SprT family zinc-dependent metalloprotease [Rhodanobacter sp.]
MPNTEARRIRVSGFQVDVVRKDIKNLHLGVYPPDGRVRVAAPLATSAEAIRLAVVDKLAWIRRQQARFAAQPRQSSREMVNGESHYFLGRRYLLRLHEHDGAGRVELRGIRMLDLFARPGSTPEQRKTVLLRWYRSQLRTELQPLVEKWQSKLGVTLTDWRIKRMRTRWGGCNPETARAWFNLELAKTAPACLDYIVLHELAHLIEQHHNDRFMALLDRYMPHWRQHRELLNSTPLGDELWH